MKLNAKLPKWVFIVTMIIAIVVIVLIVWQAAVILTDIRQISLSIAEIGKDYCGADKHREERLERIGFCGWSTDGSCNDDRGCTVGGCSNQVCQSKNEEPVITTCEYAECYNAESYNVECKCINKECKWD